MKRFALSAAAVASAFAIAGCSHSLQVPAPQNTSAEALPAQAATNSSANPATFSSVYVMTTTTSDGNSVQETLSFGRPVAPADAPAVSGGNLQSQSCLTVDYTHDLVVPFDFKLKNLNTSLPLPAQYGITYDYAGGNGAIPEGEDVRSVQFFADGPQCEDVDTEDDSDTAELIALATSDGLAPGASVESSGYVDFSQAVQPAFPHGDPSLLQNAFLVLYGGPDPTSAKYISGNWVTHQFSDGDLPSVPLAGGT